MAQVSRNRFSTSVWQLRSVWRWCEWKQRQFSPFGHAFPYGHGDGTNSASPACMWVHVESSHSRLKQDDLLLTLDILYQQKFENNACATPPASAIEKTSQTWEKGTNRIVRETIESHVRDHH